MCAAMKDSIAKLLSWSEVFGWWCTGLAWLWANGFSVRQVVVSVFLW